MNEELIGLAVKLDELRLLANSIPEAAPQSGVYGSISIALTKTLELITGSDTLAQDVYLTLMDGGTVREALEAMKGRRLEAIARMWAYNHGLNVYEGIAKDISKEVLDEGGAALSEDELDNIITLLESADTTFNA